MYAHIVRPFLIGKYNQLQGISEDYNKQPARVLTEKGLSQKACKILARWILDVETDNQKQNNSYFFL